MVVDDKQYRDLSEELTYRIPSNNPDVPITIRNISIVNSNIQGGKKLVSIPSGRTDLIPKEYTVDDKLSLIHI